MSECITTARSRICHSHIILTLFSDDGIPIKCRIPAFTHHDGHRIHGIINQNNGSIGGQTVATIHGRRVILHNTGCEIGEVGNRIVIRHLILANRDRIIGHLGIFRMDGEDDQGEGVAIHNRKLECCVNSQCNALEIVRDIRLTDINTNGVLILNSGNIQHIHIRTSGCAIKQIGVRSRGIEIE